MALREGARGHHREDAGGVSSGLGVYVGLDRYPGRYVGSPPLGPDWEGRTEVAARLTG